MVLKNIIYLYDIVMFSCVITLMLWRKLNMLYIYIYIYIYNQLLNDRW